MRSDQACAVLRESQRSCACWEDSLLEAERHAPLDVQGLEIGVGQQGRYGYLAIRGNKARDLLSRRPHAGGEVDLREEESSGVLEVDEDFETRIVEREHDVDHFRHRAARGWRPVRLPALQTL